RALGVARSGDVGVGKRHWGRGRAAVGIGAGHGAGIARPPRLRPSGCGLVACSCVQGTYADAAMDTQFPSYAEPRPTTVGVAHLVYALHAVSLGVGAWTAATVVGSFLFGWPSIIAVILNYALRGEARGTWLESHFRWQIRTFWLAALWSAVVAI